MTSVTESLLASLRSREPIRGLLTSMNAVHAANPDAILVSPEERDALIEAVEAVVAWHNAPTNAAMRRARKRTEAAMEALGLPIGSEPTEPPWKRATRELAAAPDDVLRDAVYLLPTEKRNALRRFLGVAT